MLFSYSYGLKIATLSSKKLGDSYEGTLKNNYLYNDKELFDDADLNWYDYGFRNYDPQIGRFTQLDPLTDRYPFLTPFQYASCDPITNIDVDGLEPANVVHFIKGIKAAGASNITQKIIAAGRYAGSWSIAWNKAGIAFVRIFKIAGAATNAVGKAAGIISIASKIANVIQLVSSMASEDGPRSWHGPIHPKLDNTPWNFGPGYGKVFTSEDGHGDGDGRKGEVEGKDGDPINIDGVAATFGGMGKLGHPSKWFETSFTAFEGAHVLHKEGFLGKEEDTNLPDPPLDKKPSFYQQIEVKKFWTYDSTKEQYFFDQGLDTNNVYYIKESGSIKTPDTMVHLKFPTHLRKGH